MRIIRNKRIIRASRTRVLQGARTVFVRHAERAGHLTIIHARRTHQRVSTNAASIFRGVIRLTVHFNQFPNFTLRNSKARHVNHTRLVPHRRAHNNIAPFLQAYRVGRKAVPVLSRRVRRINRNQPLIRSRCKCSTAINQFRRTRAVLRTSTTIHKNSSSTQLHSLHATNNKGRGVHQHRRGRHIRIRLVRH